jgi:hypothetical protein
MRSCGVTPTNRMGRVTKRRVIFPSARLPMALNELLKLPDNHHRKIGNVTLVPSQDLISLVDGSRLPGNVINAYGALLQQQCEASGVENRWVFSTWLAPVLQGVKATRMDATIESYVVATVRD